MTQENALVVTEQRVARIKADIALSDALVQNVLEAGVDYGQHPGTKSQALKDPGAATIINAFNCYPKAEILFREVTDTKISYVIDVSLVSREDDQVKSSGTGACTTLETKFGYRWTPFPEGYGYERSLLKKRTRDGKEQFRIPNPEWQELENTILKMARKRAEVDAAMALPGVSRFMSKLNLGRLPARSSGPPSEDWSGFWPRTRAMGLQDEEVHQLLDVKSMKDWRDQGRTMNDAIRKLAEELDKAIQENQ